MEISIFVNKSVELFGGNFQDYFKIHKFFEKHKCKKCSIECFNKSEFASDVLCVEYSSAVFGEYIINSEGSEIFIGDIIKNHILLSDDLSKRDYN